MNKISLYKSSGQVRNLIVLATLALGLAPCSFSAVAAPTYVTTLARTPLGESSGICPSHRTEGVYWTHNDSGGGNKIYAFDISGAHLGTVTLTGASLSDFEDIASATVNDVHYLLAADTGDNARNRWVVPLFLFEEPAAATAPLPTGSITRINIDWHQSDQTAPPDCEAVALSPTGEIYLATKYNPSILYVFKSSYLIPGATDTLERVATLTGVRYATGLDISPDGQHMVVLSDPNGLQGKGTEYTIGAGRSTWQASDFTHSTVYPKVTTDGPQVEAICYSANADRFYTTSEDGHNSSGSGSCKLYQVMRSGSPTVPDTTAPSAPSAVNATANSSSQITITWTASTDNVAATRYDIFRNGGTTAIATATGTSYVNSGLTASTTYSYVIKARDAAGNVSAASLADSATTFAPPPDTSVPSIPAGLSFSFLSDTSTTITWTASTDNVSVTGYDIYRGGAYVGTSNTTHYTNSSLTPTTAYIYTIKAKDAAGNQSAASAPITITTLAVPDGIAPSIPSDVVANATSDTSIIITWTAATDNVKISAYEVLRNGIVVRTVTTTTYTDTNLTAATRYTYTVRAKDTANNTSLASAEVPITTLEVSSSSTPASESRSGGGSCGLGSGIAGLGTLLAMTLMMCLRHRSAKP